MRLRSKSPYFSVLASYLKPVQASVEQGVPTAATDGRRLLVNKDFWLKELKPIERDFVLVHEVLHAALGHCTRVGMRDPYRWNIAADFVVNLIAKDAGFHPPANLLHDEKYRGMSVEEVYLLLPPGISITLMCPGDIMKAPAGEAVETDRSWKMAKASAAAVAKMAGKDPLGAELQIMMEASNRDWREVLWRDLASDVSDFVEWDRRMVHDETYVEAMEPEEKVVLECAICIDTSGSTQAILGRFLGEVRQILSLYSQTKVSLYFADAAIIGPLPIDELERPRGGGGTSFVPFFDEVEKVGYKRAIYLTDLEGSFPAVEPNCKVVWIVPPGSPHTAPFGEVVRMLD